MPVRSQPQIADSRRACSLDAVELTSQCELSRRQQQGSAI